MDEWYNSLEEKFRGSKRLIEERLKKYMEIIESYKDIRNQKLKILDLGCGRCEFLKILKENFPYFELIGVDINPYIVKNCYKITENIFIEDILQFLKTLPDESVDIVSLFHILEHLDFTQLQILIKEIYRVLDRKGIVLLEFPNITHPHVISYYFWLDPTHKRPLPADLVFFIAVNAGFEEIIKFTVHPLYETKYLYLLNYIDYIKQVGADISMIFFKNRDIFLTPQLQNTIKNFVNKNKSLEYYEALEKYSFYIQNYNFNILFNIKEIQKYIQILDKKTQKLEQDTNLILNSDFWKLYNKLSQFKNIVINIHLAIIKHGVVFLLKNAKFREFLIKILNNKPGLKIALKKFFDKMSFTEPKEEDIEEKFLKKKIPYFLKRKKF